ncbi:hypothetical protein [Azospirillum agricola]|uniref:hypothetical protein n=1 Tax=Azospirillum agricola TaxID=1720247 RepID=UPI000A0F1945|nr:hypothetical protein [Azospirillum agricola]MBP2232396.1 hypothetical protein [Azospirillum agricola]SMH62967.1 hypothetical protein SAMN02982994_6793 [Azospirillum lipoferum]
MRGTDRVTIPSRLAAALAMLLPGCVQLPQSPDSDYRQAFEKALAVAQCESDAVQGMWAAYGRWYAIASSITGHRRTDEAAALLRQGEMFAIIGCPGVARASYATLLQRFPEPDLTALRESARAALQALPPPPPPPGMPTPVAPALQRPAATPI